MLDFGVEGSPTARPFTRNQALENQAFLKALRRTGNMRLAARETGVKWVWVGLKSFLEEN
jgi:nitroreductase